VQKAHAHNTHTQKALLAHSALRLSFSFSISINLALSHSAVCVQEFSPFIGIGEGSAFPL
jgi:hypothetical protein